MFVSRMYESEATNWHMFADLDDGSCVFEESSNNCIADLDYSGEVGATDLLLFLSAFGDTCE